MRHRIQLTSASNSRSVGSCYIRKELETNERMLLYTVRQQPDCGTWLHWPSPEQAPEDTGPLCEIDRQDGVRRGALENRLLPHFHSYPRIYSPSTPNCTRFD